MEKQDLNLVVTEDRIKDMPLETFYHIDSPSPKVMVDFVSHFVTGEGGEYLPQSDAVALVLAGRKVSDIEAIMTDLKDAMEEMAVPKV